MAYLPGTPGNEFQYRFHHATSEIVGNYDEDTLTYLTE